MAPRGPPRAPKGPGPASRAPSAGAPPPPRSRPLLLLLPLLLLPPLPVAGGAAGRPSEPGLRGPIARLTRSLPASDLAGRALPRGGEDGPERGADPGAPGPAPGPGEDGAPAAGQGRWARAASVAGAASPALTSSSFVLKGDATHNQAMVHWTGENSSVSDLCAPRGRCPAHLGPAVAAGFKLFGEGSHLLGPLLGSGYRLPGAKSPDT